MGRECNSQIGNGCAKKWLLCVPRVLRCIGGNQTPGPAIMSSAIRTHDDANCVRHNARAGVTPHMLA